MTCPTARDEQAAYWFLRLRDADVTPEEIQEGLRWQRQCPENEMAFARIEAFWRAWPEVSGVRSSALQIRAHRRLRTGMRWLAAAAFLLTLVGAWIILPRQGIHTVVSSEYATGIGEVRTVSLDDGSQVVLGGATSIRTSFSPDERQVFLADGEAIFRVRKDLARPFIVSAAEGAAQAMGTVFNVHRGPAGTTVTVLEGIVEVRPTDGPRSRRAQLRPGEQVALLVGGELGEARHVNADDVTSWRTGRKVFIDESLASVVADLNRYSTRPISLAATNTAAAVRVTGAVKVNEIRTWLQALEPVAGVSVIDNEQGLLLVAPPTER